MPPPEFRLPQPRGRRRRSRARGRTARLFASSLLGGFGAASAFIQFVGPAIPAAYARPGLWTVASVAPCIVWAAVRARPRTHVRSEFKYPGMAIVIEPGDLFERTEHLVVGFCDTFDTAVAPDGPISATSVQGQLLDRRYQGDARRLDRDLAAALRLVRPVARERRAGKPLGKLPRYPVGTVAVLGGGRQLVFGVAYSRLGNDAVARSSVEELWHSLNRLWDAIYLRGQQDAVALPLLGAGLARLTSLEAQDILRLILLSFVARSRERRVCRELRVLIRPQDTDKIDLDDAAGFLRSLGAGGER